MHTQFMDKLARGLNHRLEHYLEDHDQPELVGAWTKPRTTEGRAPEKAVESLEAVLKHLGHESHDEALMLGRFLSSDRHFTAATFQAFVREGGLDLPFDRVCAALDLFTALGWADKNYDETGEAVYERSGAGPGESPLTSPYHHDHMVCRGCGRNLEFNRSDIDGLIEETAEEAGFQHLQHKLVIYGLCPECQRRRDSGLRICEAAVGEEVAITRLTGHDEMVGRLSGLGLRKGATMKVLGRQGQAMIVLLDNSRLALDEEMCQNIWVR